MGIKIITAAPLQMEADEIRMHARIDSAAEDDLIEAWVLEAQQQAQHISGRAIGTQTIELAFDAFPGGPIEIKPTPIQAVQSVRYVDVTGAWQTMPTDAYVLDDFSEFTGWLAPADGASWPATSPVMNAVRVTYAAGFFPPCARSFVAVMASHRYEHREAVSEIVMHEVPMGAADILDPIRDWSR